MSRLLTSFGDVAAIESDGELPLLVFLHGIQGTKELFLPILKEPFVRKHATLAIDFLGFGESSVSHDFDYSISSFACAVEEILHPRASAVVLIGHSLGGMVATRLLESGLQVKGLISLEGNLRLADCGASKEIAALSLEQFIEDYFPKLKEQLSQSSEPSAPVRLSALRKVDPRVLFQTARGIVAESTSEHLYQLLQQTAVPSLLLVGARSEFSTRSLPGTTEIAEIPNAGHFLLQDNYPVVASQIQKFLAKYVQRPA